MFESSPRSCLRDRILNELRFTIKQIFVECTKEKQDSQNKVWLSHLLIKNLEQSLRHGLKNLQNGYWPIVKNITHPLILEHVNKLPKTEIVQDSKSVLRGRTWVVLALNDNTLANYLECLVRDDSLNKYYEDWSILRHNESAQRLVSLVCGLDSIGFDMKVEYINVLPLLCEFWLKELDIIEPLSTESSKRHIVLTSSVSLPSLASPVDSGVVFGDSESEVEPLTDSTNDFSNKPCGEFIITSHIDLINGNITQNQLGVVLRKKSNDKNIKKRVSFHEDCKSPDGCRRLKWDCENLRYSWAGETDLMCYRKNKTICESFEVLDLFMNQGVNKEARDLDNAVDVTNLKHQKEVVYQPVFDTKEDLLLVERGVPEGEESPPIIPLCTVPTNKTDNLDKKLNLESIKTRNKSIIVKRFLHSIKKQRRSKKLFLKSANVNPYPLYIKDVLVPKHLSTELNEMISSETNTNKKVESEVPVILTRFISEHDIIYKYFTIPHNNQIIILTNKCIVYLDANKYISNTILYENIDRIVLYPFYHLFMIFEKQVNKKTVRSHVFVTGVRILTENIIGSIEYCVRREFMELPFIFNMFLDDLKALNKLLVKNNVMNKSDVLLYYGNIFVDEESRPNSVNGVVKEGVLMFRIVENSGDVWTPVLCTLSNGTLELQTQDSSLVLHTIDLFTCQKCERSVNQERPHTFQLTVHCPHNRKYKPTQTQSQKLHSSQSPAQKLNTIKDKFNEMLQATTKKINKIKTNKNDDLISFEFAGSDEYEISDWLQAILFASKKEDEYTEPTSQQQTLIVTNESVITCRECYQPQHDIQVTLAASLTDMVSYQYASHRGHCYCVLEFSCMEANSTSGDCILYFVNQTEMDKFKQVLSSYWSYYNKTTFPTSELNNIKLISHCNKTVDNLFYSSDRLV